MKRTSLEDYLVQVKNSMLFHFSRKDIYDTVEDLKLFFESGKEEGKTEEELCDSLGTPQEFVCSLRADASREHSVCLIIGYILCGLIVSFISIGGFLSATPTWLCVLPIILPIFIYHLLGGKCLQAVRSESKKHLKNYIIYSNLTFVLIGTEQVLIYMLNVNMDSVISFMSTTYRASSILIIVAIVVILVAIYRLKQGFYFSLGILSVSIGTVCSSFLYNNYLKDFGRPGGIYVGSSIPYIVSLLFSMLCYILIFKRKDKE